MESPSTQWETLRKSEERLRLAVDSLPVLISYVDSGQRYRLVNRCYEEWFGRSRADLEGRHVRDVLGGKAYRLIQGHIKKALSGRVTAYEKEIPFKDAGQRCVRTSYVPHLGERGKIAGAFVLCIDVTERKRAEDELRKAHEELGRRVEERTSDLRKSNEALKKEVATRRRTEALLREREERFRGVFENSPLGMLIIDPRFQIIRANRSFCAMLGYTEPELIRKTFLDITHPDDIGKNLSFTKKIFRGEIPHFQLEKRYLHKNGSVV
jgi:PAS domain S-box-containing protein